MRSARAIIYGIGRNNVTPYGMTVEDNIIERVIDELERAVDLTGWRARRSIAFNRQSPVVKKGLASMPVKFGISFNRPALNQAGALVHVYTDGSVMLNHGGTEMGQGLFVKVAQVVAEAFQIDLDHIRMSATSDRQGAEHLADRGLVRLGPQRHGGAQRRRADQGAHDRGRGRAFRCAARARSLFAANRIYAGNRSISFR